MARGDSRRRSDSRRRDSRRRSPRRRSPRKRTPGRSPSPKAKPPPAEAPEVGKAEVVGGKPRPSTGEPTWRAEIMMPQGAESEGGRREVSLAVGLSTQSTGGSSYGGKACGLRLAIFRGGRCAPCAFAGRIGWTKARRSGLRFQVSRQRHILRAPITPFSR